MPTVKTQTLEDIGRYHEQWFKEWGCESIGEYYLKRCAADNQLNPRPLGVQYGEIHTIKRAMNLTRIIDNRPLLLS